ncbi:MAG: RidA family protein [Nitrospinota bacterium]
MKKEVIHPPGVARGILPHSLGMAFGDLLFCSGQFGLDPETGKLVEGGISAETKQACENLKRIVEAARSSLDKALKVTIFMADVAELMEMNKVFNEYFPSEPPARTTTAVKEHVQHARVQIELIAHR